MKKLLNLLLVAVLAVCTCACDDDDAPIVDPHQGRMAYVLNEGSSGGTLSRIDLETGEVTNDAYLAANNDIPLGAFPQSLAVADNYLVMAVTETSDKGYIEIADKKTLKHVASITNVGYPRGVVVKGDFAYVSNGNYTGEVIVVNLTTLEQEGESIPVGVGPEEMIIHGNSLFVACSGGWNNDGKTVEVINLDTREKVATIPTLDCPRDMVMDAADNIWVFCGGVTEYDDAWQPIGVTNQGFTKINTADNTAENILFDNMVSTASAKRLAISADKKTVYFARNKEVYSFAYDASTINESTPFVSLNEPHLEVYGIDVDPVTDALWVCGSTGYTTPAEVVVYNNLGTEQKTIEVGVSANSTTFLSFE